MAIQNILLTASPQEIVLGSQGDPNNGAAITAIYICNDAGANITFNIYALPNGFGPAGPDYLIYNAVPLAVGDTYVVDMEKIILSPGDSLWASCNVLGVATGPVAATVSFIGI